MQPKYTDCHVNGQYFQIRSDNDMVSASDPVENFFDITWAEELFDENYDENLTWQ